MMDQIEEEFRKVFPKLDSEKITFSDVFEAFKETCYQLKPEERKDISLFSIKAETDLGILYLSFYYQLILTRDNEPTDTSSQITLTISCLDKEERLIHNEKLRFEAAFELDNAFQKLNNTSLCQSLLNKTVRLHL